MLPDSLTDALTQASSATALALQGIGGRYLVTFFLLCTLTAEVVELYLTVHCAELKCSATQVEVLIPEFWDPAAGAVFTGLFLDCAVLVC